jgi:hypothetical protein
MERVHAEVNRTAFVGVISQCRSVRALRFPSPSPTMWSINTDDSVLSTTYAGRGRRKPSRRGGSTHDEAPESPDESTP